MAKVGTPKEIIAWLLDQPQDKVFEDSGVRLECEVRFLGGEQ